jgi:hypothetical protein
MNPPISVTKTGQLRVSDAMFAKGPQSFNSPRAQNIAKLLQNSLQSTRGLVNLNKTILLKYIETYAEHLYYRL